MGDLGYLGILNQLQRQSELELARPQNLDIATAGVKRIDQELTAQRQFKQRMDSEGKKLIDRQAIEELAKESGQDPSIFSRFEGLYMKPNDIEDYAHQQVVAAQYSNPKQSEAVKTSEGFKAAVTNDIFPKPVTSSGKPNVRLEIDGKVYEIPNAVYESATRAAQDTGRPYTDFINLNNFGTTGFKPSLFKNPQSGEENMATGAGAVVGLTGPKAKPKDQPLRNDYNQLNAVEKKRVEDAASEVLKDPVIKGIRETQSKIGLLRREIEANIPQGIGVVQSQIARTLASERGALAEGDVGRASGSQAVQDRFDRYLSKISSGEMTPQDMKGFMDLIDIIEKGSSVVLEQSIDGHVKRVGSTMKDVSPEVIRERIGITAPTGSQGTIVGRRKVGQ